MDRSDLIERLEAGQIRWHCSDEESGPDVGISLGLDNGFELYVGELANVTLSDADVELSKYPDGWWLAFVNANDIRVIGAVVDQDAARDLLDTMASAIRALQTKESGHGG